MTFARERPAPEQMAADYRRTGSIRTLAAEYGISSAAMRTWLFEAGIDPIGTRGRPTVEIDLDDVKTRRARGDSWTQIATDLEIAASTLRRRAAE